MDMIRIISSMMMNIIMIKNIIYLEIFISIIIIMTIIMKEDLFVIKRNVFHI
jgi:hypothetical protein